MTKTGMALRFYGKSEPLKLEQVTLDDVEDGEVLVKVKSAGVCASDLHFIRRTEKKEEKPGSTDTGKE